MSFFATQVKSGQEVDTKEMLKSIFYKRKEFQLKESAIAFIEQLKEVLGGQRQINETSEYYH